VLLLVALVVAGQLLAQPKSAPHRGGLSPKQAVLTMRPAEGFQVELFAAEPMLMNPTSLDIDHRGRVWVSEAVNYRRYLHRQPLLRPEGDRIVVLIDTDGDGRADQAQTFYQGAELIAPLSVCVIPQPPDGKTLRVLVAQSPDILEFWDRNGDLKADGPPNKFLTGFGGFDHDHGVHGLHLGPDGKLYFTVGDAGVGQGRDRDGRPIPPLQARDGHGRRWVSNNNDCRAGTVWRCHLDGSHLELIAHNFRNNYEACVDSFGEIWLSDNDDDGNQQTRICFVLPGGNYGYHPRGPGQSHWHEEQPGIVHKVLRTGFGSPTGIQFYEGDLFGSKYMGALLHCDAGPREVRAFLRRRHGAGYQLQKEILLTSTDNWFRPADVCVAPDGSIFVADWYDRGVGGHGMGDPFDGRIYRLTPKGYKGYQVPQLQLKTQQGLLQAWLSPNNATRTLAMPLVVSKLESQEWEWTQLRQGCRWGVAHGRIIHALAQSLRGRLELLRAFMTITQAEAPPWTVPEIEAIIRTVASQLASKQLEGIAFDTPQLDGIAKYRQSILREYLLLAQHLNAQQCKPLFYTLAQAYDGTDHFYRAALNIACGLDPKRRAEILADFPKYFPNWTDQVAELVWELRPQSVWPRLKELLQDPQLTVAQKLRVLDILATSDDPTIARCLLAILTAANSAPEMKNRALEYIRQHLPNKWKTALAGPELAQAIDLLMNHPHTRSHGLKLLAVAQPSQAAERVATLLTDPTTPRELRLEAVRTLGQLRSHRQAVELLRQMVRTATDVELRMEVIRALGQQIIHSPQGAPAEIAQQTLQDLVLGTDVPVELRKLAIETLAGTRSGTVWLLDTHQQGRLPMSLVAETGRLLRNSPFQGERNRAWLLFPAPGKLNLKNLPSIAVLARRSGDPARGKRVWQASLNGAAQCAKCHAIRGVGGQIGPDLSMIGKKASREDLYESILYPSKAIADQYLAHQVTTVSEVTITGRLVADSPEGIILRDANGKDTFIARSQIAGEVRKLKVSLMPDDIAAALTEEELADLVAYLETLRTPALSPTVAYVAGPFSAKSMEEALDHSFGPEKEPFTSQQKFGNISWQLLRSDARYYFDLLALHGDRATRSASYLYWEIESPREQTADILLGTDDGARLWCNGRLVWTTRATRAAVPEQDRVAVTLQPGKNVLLLKVANGDGPHGAYLTLLADEELRLLTPSRH
jgi:putative membrane-bound dehydrogenase-like protein